MCVLSVTQHYRVGRSRPGRGFDAVLQQYGGPRGSPLAALGVTRLFLLATLVSMPWRLIAVLVCIPLMTNGALVFLHTILISQKSCGDRTE
jgi:hypothetical protein